MAENFLQTNNPVYELVLLRGGPKKIDGKKTKKWQIRTKQNIQNTQKQNTIELTIRQKYLTSIVQTFYRDTMFHTCDLTWSKKILRSRKENDLSQSFLLPTKKQKFRIGAARATPG